MAQNGGQKKAILYQKGGSMDRIARDWGIQNRDLFGKGRIYGDFTNT